MVVSKNAQKNDGTNPVIVQKSPETKFTLSLMNQSLVIQHQHGSGK
jgi:hypothetical protein